MNDFINRRVHEFFWKEDKNCATTAIKILGEIFDVKIADQVIHATIGLNGAGKSGAQCGLFESSLLFYGIYGKSRQLPDNQIMKICNGYAAIFKKRFRSLQCCELRPEGFSESNPKHLCEPLACDALEETVRYIEREIKVSKRVTNP